MFETPISTPPKAYMDIIDPPINTARGFLESGEVLQAFAVVGSLSRNQVVPVMIQSGADADKDQRPCKQPRSSASFFRGLKSIRG